MNRLPAFLALCVAVPLSAESNDPWTLAQSSHFEVFSQTTDQTVYKALLWFEQLRTFFEQDGLQIVTLQDQNKPALRVVGFRNEKEYAPYRLRDLASAYFASDGHRDYILLASLQSDQYSVAAHEYWHYVLHASGLKLPSFLQEGIAEVFSTLHLTANGYLLGGDLPARSQTLRDNARRLLPVASLLSATDASATANGRKEAELFYAESWALADMLIASPKYAPHFRDLVSEFGTGARGPQPFEKIYAVSMEEVSEDLANWVKHPHGAQLRFGRAMRDTGDSALAPSFELSPAHSHFLQAELSLVSRHIEEAKSRFEELLREQPTNPEVYVSLGTIALRRSNRAEALKCWQRAIQLNVRDAELCYRYAVLAQEAGLPEKDEKVGLERAVFLAPGFDDARWRLALIHYHEADYRATLDNLRKMAVPADPHRRYAYWTAMASSQLELNENEDAQRTALEAENAAQTESERAAARQLANVAVTDLNVQFSTDANGQSHMVTTRIPHGTKNWNPFIEPSDAIQHSNGRLSRVLCKDDKLTGFLLLTAAGSAVTLDVADPTRVLMLNSPNEFYCGPTALKSVAADYAVTKSSGQIKNILRGLTFQP